MKHKLFLLLMCLLLMLPAGAWAGNCFTIEVDQLDTNSLNSNDYVARHLSSSAQGLRVRKQLSGNTAVRLTLTEMQGRTLIFDKDYGWQSGTFDSGVIYLPYMGDGTTPYLVTLYAGDMVYGIPYMHLQARLSYNGACTRGVRLRDLSTALDKDWLMGTMLDLNQLRQSGRQTIDLCASNQYIVGTATVSMKGSDLRVEASFHSSANVELHEANVYVVTDCSAFSNGRFPSSHSLGEWVNVGGADTALVYLPMQISYDPSGLSSFWYDAGQVQSQFGLWNDSCSASGGDSVWNADAWSDDGWSDWSDDGWSDGWDNTVGWEDSGWEEGAGW